MAEAITPTSSWADTFGNVLNTVVDTGAQYALQLASNKQAQTVAAQQTAQTQAQAAAQVATAQAQTTTSNNSNLVKYAVIGGVALVGLVVLAAVLRRR